MDRRAVVVGNWKMELSHKGEVELARSLRKLVKTEKIDQVDAIVCPSYPSLPAISDMLKESELMVGAQSVHWEEKGAHTGSVAVGQISPFATWCIVGHSEQRALTGETEDQVQKKANLLLKHGVSPLVCIGETAEERDQDRAVEKVTAQMNSLLDKATRTSLLKMVVVYEPIWAISANEPDELPDPADVAGTMLLMRKLAAARFGGETAQRMRVIYGGSVTPKTAGDYLHEPGVDGVLVGGASLRPRSWLDIVKEAEIS